MNRRSNARAEQGGILVNLLVLLCIAVLCALVYVARRPILRLLAESWVIDQPAAHADAIIVLSDDNFYADRATRAAELSRQAVAPVVVASGRRLRPNAGFGELMEHDLIERGVPKDKIVHVDHDANDTIQELEVLAKFAADKHWKSVILVTSNYHTRRARYIAGKVFPAEIAVSVASARDGDFDPERWWEKTRSVKLFGHEFFGMFDAFWELRDKPRATDAAALFWADRPPTAQCALSYSGHGMCKTFPCALHTLSAVLSLTF
jgi:uncharacterized SAM-binding protein YcdF (DUF218 family)